MERPRLLAFQQAARRNRKACDSPYRRGCGAPFCTHRNNRRGGCPFSEQVDIDAFRKVELCVVEILAAEKVEKSKKLIRLQVDLGTEKRQILAGIAESYTPEELVGKRAIAITNLKPTNLMGHKSEGMLLAAIGPDGKPILLAPEKPAPAGAKVT